MFTLLFLSCNRLFILFLTIHGIVCFLFSWELELEGLTIGIRVVASIAIDVLLIMLGISVKFTGKLNVGVVLIVDFSRLPTCRDLVSRRIPAEWETVEENSRARDYRNYGVQCSLLPRQSWLSVFV